MALPTAGKLATVSYKAGNVASIGSWSLDIASDALDVTTLTTAAPQWKDFISGLSAWSGSVDGFWNMSTGGSTGQRTLQNNTITPATGTLILQVDQTRGGKYSGDIVLTGVSVGAAVDGVATVSYSFQGNGALTFTTTT